MKCLNCDREIEKPKRRFCSHKCGSEYWNKNHEGITLCVKYHRELHNINQKGGKKHNGN